MLKKLFYFSFLLIITKTNLYAKDYECEPTQFHTKPEYYNVIIELEKNKVIYVWKISTKQFVKANNITEIKDNIIFYEELETYYTDGNKLETGKIDFKKFVIREDKDFPQTDGGTIYTYSKFDVGNNVEYVTHRCKKVS